MKKIVVIGSKGFIGRRLVARLKAEGAKVSEIDIGDNVEDISGSWDAMFNMAWVGKGGALRADYNVQMGNVKVALDLYREAQRLKCKHYICMGTIGEKMVKLPECEKIKSQNFIYALSKDYLHSILNSIGTDACRVVWVTLGNIYGGSDAGGNIVDYALRAILSGKEAVFGPALQPYDFIHVDDTVRALACLGLCGKLGHDEYYVGNGTPRPLKEYLLQIGRIAECEGLINIGGRHDDGTRYRAEWFDISALKQDTGFCPEIDFESGVRGNIVALRNE